MSKSLTDNPNCSAPDLSAAAFIADNATVMGEVSVGVAAVEGESAVDCVSE